MARLVDLFSERTVAAGERYYDYELQVGREILVPWLERRLDVRGTSVGDFGCHEGGVLQALREAGAASGIGFELDPVHVETSPMETDGRFRLEARDVLSIEPGEFSFGLVVLRDVLEHIPDPREALRRAAGALAPDGAVFVSFPPYYSAFGGHQQLATGYARALPFLHLVPERLFFRVAAVSDNAYMSAEASLADMRSVRRTRLTIRGALAAAEQAGLALDDAEFFLLRPEFRIRYGIGPVGAGPLGRVPGVREIAVMGAHLLFRPSGAAGRDGAAPA